MRHDAIIIGGGPTGSTAALVLARAGLRVAILEKAAFPRFQIGESLLPAGYDALVALGLADRLATIPHTVKFGATLVFGDDVAARSFWFRDGLVGGPGRTLNVVRAPFDAMLLDAAREAGAEVCQPLAVTRIDRLADGDVAVSAGERRFEGRVLLDCSGHATVVGRHLGTRRILDQPHLRKVAYFAHYHGVQRDGGEQAGSPVIVMCDEGWFWLIPVDERTTSVGLVLDPRVARQVAAPADRMLQWAIERCPAVQRRMRDAVGPATNMVRSDFSYHCRPYAGPGHFLLGDAATFLDPVFSTGVCLGMKTAIATADTALAMLRGDLTPQAARRRHEQLVHCSTAPLVRVIRRFYRHAFREMFMEGQGPLQVHRAVLSLLAGHVFPGPAWSIRWRWRLFEVMMDLQRWVPLCPRRPRFSLLSSTPQSLEQAYPAATAGVPAS